MEEMEAIKEAEEAAIKEAEQAIREAELGSLFDFGEGITNNGFDPGDEALTPMEPVRNQFLMDRPPSQATTMDNEEEDDDEDEGPDCKRVFYKNLKNVVDIFCIWDCGRLWIKISEVLSFIVFDPFMELFITLCILVNVIFMTLDHYNLEYDGMSPQFTSLLRNANYFFTAIFAIESFFKLAAMSPRYFFVVSTP